jgi:hypothetical protein
MLSGRPEQTATSGWGQDIPVAIAALIVWLATIGAGWSLLAIWLVEYDRTFHESATTRLPIPVMSVHALFALGGLAIWIAYLLAGSRRLALTATAVLGVVAVLGFVMVTRWIGVWRAQRARQGGADPASLAAVVDVPPERHLPVTLVIGHGVLAVATVVLVVLTALTHST